jgi:hypothetical protein
LLECLRLRVKDIETGSRQVTVRDGKGAKDPVRRVHRRHWRREGRRFERGYRSNQ